MPDLDPSIVEHKIDTWIDVDLAHQKQRPLHPSKIVDIKEEIDKLHIFRFIYPIAYTSWVSNLVPINNK
jgi:ribulose 1,5-bisphosphate carboxylase large subunit-like protein